MVLIQSHPALADDGPLALLRQRRAEAEAELPRSVLLSSCLFLTAVVAVLAGTSLLQGGRIMTWAYAPLPDSPLPPTNDFKKYFGSDPEFVIPDVIPPDPGLFVPVDKMQTQEDAPPIVVPSPGTEVGPSGLNDATGVPGAPGGAGPPGGSEALPRPGEFVYYEVAPVAVEKVQPEYPPIAQQAGMEATVLLQVLVGRDGRVQNVTVEHSAPMFDEAAVSAVRRWRFSPALSSGHPVAVWIALPVRFTLR